MENLAVKEGSKFDSSNWIKYLKDSLNKEWLPQQISCDHVLEKIHRSGANFGIPLWRCIRCEVIIQSS
jgi:hypothetical protein